jgi:hypothetical protein
VIGGRFPMKKTQKAAIFHSFTVVRVLNLTGNVVFDAFAGAADLNPQGNSMEPRERILRDGFRVLKEAFSVPDEISTLDSLTKRKATICNLFINHRLAISDIVRLLDETNGRAISALIEQGVIEDRRKVARPVNNPLNQQEIGFSFKKRPRSNWSGMRDTGVA